MWKVDEAWKLMECEMWLLDSGGCMLKRVKTCEKQLKIKKLANTTKMDNEDESECE